MRVKTIYNQVRMPEESRLSLSEPFKLKVQEIWVLWLEWQKLKDAGQTKQRLSTLSKELQDVGQINKAKLTEQRLNTLIKKLFYDFGSHVFRGPYKFGGMFIQKA